MDDIWEMLTSWLPLLAAAPPKKVGDPLAFYSVAATIIPVLVIAVLYQANVLELVSGPARFLLAYVVTAVAAFGEAATLGVLSQQVPKVTSQRQAATAILVLGISMITQPLLNSVDQNYRARRAAGKAGKTFTSALEEQDARVEQHVTELARLEGVPGREASAKRLALSDALKRVRSERGETRRKLRQQTAAVEKDMELEGFPIPPVVVTFGALCFLVAGLAGIWHVT